jgi:putative nucleotidyltransferase with HDIG domain
MVDKKIIYKDIYRHLMEDEIPSKYFNNLVEEDYFKNTYPFKLLAELKNIEQNLKYHPEGNVWNHTMMVVDNAAERKKLSKSPEILMLAALLHDIGKPSTTKIRKGKITSYDHDKVGAKMAKEFLQELNEDDDIIKQVIGLVRWHMQALFVVKDLPFADLKAMLLEVPIDEIALLTLCDRLGRGEMTESKSREEKESVDIFINKCRNYLKKDNYSRN